MNALMSKSMSLQAVHVKAKVVEMMQFYCEVVMCKTLHILFIYLAQNYLCAEYTTYYLIMMITIITLTFKVRLSI